MTLFGKQVTAAVLLTFLIGLLTAIPGWYATLSSSWHDPQGFVTAITGTLIAVTSLILHTFDPNIPPSSTPPPA